MQNIKHMLKQVSGISHPLIADMYLKKDYGVIPQDVLVIEAKKQGIYGAENGQETDDSYLVDLLLDLEDLKEKAEQRIGAFDRIDIRTI